MIFYFHLPNGPLFPAYVKPSKWASFFSFEVRALGSTQVSWRPSFVKSLSMHDTSSSPLTLGLQIASCDIVAIYSQFISENHSCLRNSSASLGPHPKRFLGSLVKSYLSKLEASLLKYGFISTGLFEISCNIFQRSRL